MLEIIAIADSGPLIFFARIKQLHLLPRLFSKVLVSPEVWNEVTLRGRKHPGAFEVSQAKWITIQSPDFHLVKSLSILVDAGEAETIALGQTTENSALLLDDGRARKIAQRLNLQHIGTIGLLLRAKRRGLIETIKPHIDALVDNGIYIRQEIIDAVLKSAGE